MIDASPLQPPRGPDADDALAATPAATDVAPHVASPFATDIGAPVRTRTRRHVPVIGARAPLVAGLATVLLIGLAVLAAPIGWLERIAYELYLDVLMPMAAAPLGTTARLAMAGAASLGGGLVVWRLLRSLHRGTLDALIARRRHRRLAATEPDHGAGHAAEIMDAAPLARPPADAPLADRADHDLPPVAPPAVIAPPAVAAPVLRRADAHPDAPSRAPLRPDRDLALPAIPAAVPVDADADGHADDPLVLTTRLDEAPVTASPGQPVLDLSEADRLDANDPAAPWLAPAERPDLAERLAPAEPLPPATPTAPPEPASPEAASPEAEPAEPPSLALLLARLEAGMAARAATLAARRPAPDGAARADQPDATTVEGVAVTAKDSLRDPLRDPPRDPLRDPALDAALSTLRRLTQGAR